MALRPVQGDPATNGIWGTLLAAWFDTFSNADSTAPGGPLKAAAVQAALGGSRAYVGTADPSSTLSAGTEYVWFQTDGSGNLIDLWTGVV